MKLLLDAGALIAYERNHHRIIARLAQGRMVDDPLRTHAGVVAQVWRGGSGRQARLSAHLRSLEVRPLDLPLARRTGELLARSGSVDVIDAALIAMADEGDSIMTSDPDDLRRLAEHADREITIIAI